MQRQVKQQKNTATFKKYHSHRWSQPKRDYTINSGKRISEDPISNFSKTINPITCCNYQIVIIKCEARAYQLFLARQILFFDHLITDVEDVDRKNGLNEK